MPGIGFAPDGKRVYVTDTGIALGFYGRNLSSPASVYSFDVNQDGTLQNRKTFAYVASFIPDGKIPAMHPNDITTNYLRCSY
jgi:gluconolactonase